MPEEHFVSKFYSSNSIPEWKKAIGESLHYHHGFYRPGDNFEDGLERTIRNFYPWIPNGSSVLDVGCGWGGTLKMLSRDLDVSGVGVTVCPDQAEYARNQGSDVEVVDVEKTLPAGPFDIAICIECLSHIEQKQALLSRISEVAGVLLMSAICLNEDHSEPKRVFGNSM